MTVLKNIAIGRPVKPELILNYRTGTYRALNGSNVLVPTTFSDDTTLTRLSSGGRFNASGLYEFVAADLPRFDYDPVTLEALGLLIEGQATNTYPSSLDMTQTGWIPSRTTITYATGITNPTGSTGVSKISETTVTGYHHCYRNSTVTAGDKVYRYAVVKAAERTRCYLTKEESAFGVLSVVTFDLSAGTILSNPSAIDAHIKSLGNGFWIISFNATATMTTSAFVSTLGTVNDSGLTQFAGTAGYGIYVWDSGIVINGLGEGIIPTTTAAVTRSSDYVEIASGYKTIILDHDIATGRPLLATGSNDLLTSAGAGRSVLTMDDSYIYTSHNGLPYVQTTKPPFSSTLKLLRNGANTIWANGHLKKLIAFSRKLSVDEAMAA